MVIGAVLFIGVGCLVITAVDSVPRNLVVNALVLSTLSIVTGMVFILDTCLSNRRNDKKSHLPKNTRYGDIARTRAAAAVDTVDSVRTTNGVHKNGVHSKNEHGNGLHANGEYTSGGGILKRETVTEKRQNGLLQTTETNGGRAVETRSEGVQTSSTTRGEETDDDGASTVHQYGRKYLENRGFDGQRHADWYDTDMDLPKMKKLEINVPLDESPDYRRRYVIFVLNRLGYHFIIVIFYIFFFFIDL